MSHGGLERFNNLPTTRTLKKLIYKTTAESNNKFIVPFDEEHNDLEKNNFFFLPKTKTYFRIQNKLEREISVENIKNKEKISDDDMFEMNNLIPEQLYNFLNDSESRKSDFYLIEEKEQNTFIKANVCKIIGAILRKNMNDDENLNEDIIFVINLSIYRSFIM